jgi:dipeptidyl aminopeptidase/acylaminoacyl peptidase
VVSKTPWSIWVVDVSDPQPRMVWQAKEGTGSVFYPMDQSYSPGQPGMFWMAGDRIVFPWEGDGWRHLYAVPVTGGEAALLTPGDGEVETAALSPDRGTIFYATNIGDLGRRHIAMVRLNGPAVMPAVILTPGEKDQWSPIALAGGKVGYVSAGWADPPIVAIRNAKGSVRTAAFPRPPIGFPSRFLVKPSLVDFPAADGHTAYGQLFVPAKPNGCAIIFSHGGIRRQMLPGFHYMDAYHYLYAMNQYLASRGCVVLSVEYRSSIMRGEAFRNAPGWGFAENSELIDFVGAAKWLVARKDVDASRGVGIYGLSWGGYMTANALAQHSDIFKVGFDMAGVHTSSNEAGVKFSAVGNLDGWTSPVFLVQGDDDMNVNFNEGTALARAMQTRRPQVEFRQQVLPGQTHDLYLTFEQLARIYADGSDFLLSHMGVK